MKGTIAPAVIALVFVASPAAASHWTVDHTKSHLGFVVNWDKEPFSAEFKHWDAEIDFDLDELHRGVDVGVDLPDEPLIHDLALDGDACSETQDHCGNRH